MKGWEAGAPSRLPTWTIDFKRRNAVAQLINSEHIISDEFVKVTANLGNGKGGSVLVTLGDLFYWLALTNS